MQISNIPHTASSKSEPICIDLKVVRSPVICHDIDLAKPLNIELSLAGTSWQDRPGKVEHQA